MNKTDLLSIEKIEKAIYFIRGEKVMLDRDLALLYGVQTKILNKAVKRNLGDYAFDTPFADSHTKRRRRRGRIGLLPSRGIELVSSDEQRLVSVYFLARQRRTLLRYSMFCCV